MRECRTCYAQIDPARFQDHMKWHGRTDRFTRIHTELVNDLITHAHQQYRKKWRYRKDA